MELKPDEENVVHKIRKTEGVIEQAKLEDKVRLAQVVKNERKKKDTLEKYRIFIKEGDQLFNQSLFENSIEKGNTSSP